MLSVATHHSIGTDSTDLFSLGATPFAETAMDKTVGAELTTGEDISGTNVSSAAPPPPKVQPPSEARVVCVADQPLPAPTRVPTPPALLPVIPAPGAHSASRLLLRVLAASTTPLPGEPSSDQPSRQPQPEQATDAIASSEARATPSAFSPLPPHQACAPPSETAAADCKMPDCIETLVTPRFDMSPPRPTPPNAPPPVPAPATTEPVRVTTASASGPGYDPLAAECDAARIGFIAIPHVPAGHVARMVGLSPTGGCGASARAAVGGHGPGSKPALRLPPPVRAAVWAPWDEDAYEELRRSCPETVHGLSLACAPLLPHLVPLNSSSQNEISLTHHLWSLCAGLTRPAALFILRCAQCGRIHPPDLCPCTPDRPSARLTTTRHMYVAPEERSWTTATFAPLYAARRAAPPALAASDNTGSALAVSGSAPRPRSLAPRVPCPPLAPPAIAGRLRPRPLGGLHLVSPADSAGRHRMRVERTPHSTKTSEPYAAALHRSAASLSLSTEDPLRHSDGRHTVPVTSPIAPLSGPPVPHFASAPFPTSPLPPPASPLPPPSPSSDRQRGGSPTTVHFVEGKMNAHSLSPTLPAPELPSSHTPPRFPQLPSTFHPVDISRLGDRPFSAL